MNEENYKEKDFIADMLFPKYADEKYLVNLKHINVGERFIGVFKSYFGLFQHINRTKVRDELNLKNETQKVWNIVRILPDKNLVAHWMLSMDNKTLYWNIKGEYTEKIRNSKYGTIYILDETQNDYFIYLGETCDETCKFIRVTMDEEPVLDMEYTTSKKKAECMRKAPGLVPDIVCQISNKLKNNPHKYFLWLFYWIPFSNWGKEEQNRCMIQIISNEKI